jgi:hypothetical protein
MAYHVHCAQLLAVRVYADGNRELCQSASQREKRHLMYFRRITRLHERISNSRTNWADTEITYFEFREV